MVKGVIRNAEIKGRHSLEVKTSHNKSYPRIEGKIRETRRASWINDVRMGRKYGLNGIEWNED